MDLANLANLADRCAVLLRAYTGRIPLRVLVYPDPVVAGTVAVRAWFPAPMGQLDFLVERMDRSRLLAEAALRDVTECRFATWPPAQQGGFSPKPKEKV